MAEHMHRIAALMPILILVVGLAGCGAPKPINYYSLQIPAAPSTSKPTYSIDVAVGRITGPSLLQASPIVYKTGTNQIGTYKYHRWQDPPVELVQAKLISLLRSSGGYQSVTSTTTTGADYVIRGRLHEFSEVDGEGIGALITMEFELYERRSAKVLWSHFYTQLEPAQGKAVSGVAQAIDRNLDRGLREVMTELGQYFAANPSKTALLGGSARE
jgi:ABC-type uncharacterized transport system auxiliary subunit